MRSRSKRLLKARLVGFYLLVPLVATAVMLLLAHVGAWIFNRKLDGSVLAAFAIASVLGWSYVSYVSVRRHLREIEMAEKALEESKAR